MLDFADHPIPAIHEHLPHGVEKAILPGLGPYPGLSAGGGAFGQAQMPPWPVPTINVATINSAGLGSASPCSANSSTNPALNPYSEVLVWGGLRSNILNDPAVPDISMSDSQGGTYTKVGTQQKLSYNNAGTITTFWAQLFKRNQNAGAAGLASVTFTMTATPNSASTSSFLSAYIFEIRNPYNRPFKVVERQAVPQAVAATLPLTNTGDLFCLDLYAGSGAVGNESANSGFTQIAGSTAFVSNQLRLQAWASALRAQNPTRTVPAQASLGGLVSSFALWFEVTRSAQAIAFSQTDFQNSPTFQNSFTSTYNIGVPASDRQVIVYVGGAANGNTSVQWTGCTAPGVTFIPVLQAGGIANSASMYIALVPTGTTLTITLTGTGLPFHSVNIFRVVGAARLGNNQIGAISAAGVAGETVPGVRYFYGSSVNSPGAVLPNSFVPQGAVALGGGGSRSAGTTILTSGTNPWTDFVVSTSPYAKGCFKRNSSGADETNVTYQINYSGTVAMHILMAAFGP